MPEAIQYDSLHLDLSARLAHSVAVAGSPALAAETTICTVTIPANVAITKAAYLLGWCAFTVGTSGTSFRLRVRRDTIAGSTLADTGLINATAAALVEPSIIAVDTTAAPPNQVYVMTLTVTAGAAVSTVSAAALVALAA